VLDDTDFARRILDEDPALERQVAVTSARILLATMNRDASRARKELDNWPGGTEPFGVYERDLWSAVVDHLEGDVRAATDAMAAFVARAEGEGLVRVFLDTGPAGLRALRELQRLQPRAHTRRILDAAAARPTATTTSALVEQLSARELAVLRYLPTRLAYGDIARELFVSVNTLKSHVRHIFQKLGVSGRDAAVLRAEDLGLL
jgi:LuxR family maltose regulon positive regulatory protein